MKNLNQFSSNSEIENFQIKEYLFYWVFEGNGNYTQKHSENDYLKYIERNYVSKSNIN